MDRIIQATRLIAETEAKFSDLMSRILREERAKAGQANDEDQQLVLEKEKYESLKTEIERQKKLKSILAEKTRVVDDGYEELSLRLGLVNNELLNLQSANDGTKEKLKKLMVEVLEMEHEKENRVEKMKREFQSTLKMYKIYKAYLDMRIILVRPDLYLIGFSADKISPTSLTLRSFPDLEDWEVVKVGEGNPELEEELTSYLVETKDLLGLMCLARRHCKK